MATETNRSKGWLKGKPKPRVGLGHNGNHKQRYEVEDRGHDTPCWIWLLSKTEDGYGCVHGGPAHRSYYEKRHGPIAPGLQIHHNCEQRECVNPDHLEAVTAAENTRRSGVAILDWEQVREIRRLSASGIGQRPLAARFGVSRSTIQSVVRQRSWQE